MIHIHEMSEADIPYGMERTDTEQWGYSVADYKRLLFLSPKGCFIARDDDQRVGLITTVQYGEYAFMGTLIVQPEYRSQKIGDKLIHAAIEYLTGRGVKTIEFDGVFSAVPWYRRLGFKDKYLSLRFFRLPNHIHFDSTMKLHADFTPDELLQFDRRLTKRDRSIFLRRYLAEFSDSLFVAGNGRIEGYAFVKPLPENGYYIGPCIAESSEITEMLLNEILQRFGQYRLSLGVPDINANDIAIYRRYGFQHTLPSLRMYDGEFQEGDTSIAAIITPGMG
ncbi:MAG: GNAT family N-acetyltransferase [Candidatus Zixiibacteriota bacterium]